MSTPTRPNIIDVEASGFGGMSYPIEVGVALDDGSKYCALISPASGWEHWDASAESVHRIARDILQTHGKAVREVAEELNRRFAGKTLYTDGWSVDKPWLITLFHAAGLDMKFGVSALEMILSEDQMAHWHETKDNVLAESTQNRHRASFDAWVVQETYQRTRAA
jgi:hypothetical protein